MRMVKTIVFEQEEIIMKQYIRFTLKKALQTYLVILPFAVIGGITVGMYTFEYSTPDPLRL